MTKLLFLKSLSVSQGVWHQAVETRQTSKNGMHLSLTWNTGSTTWMLAWAHIHTQSPTLRMKPLGQFFSLHTFPKGIWIYQCFIECFIWITKAILGPISFWLFFPVLLRCNWHTSQAALVVKNPPANARHKRCGFNPWVRKILWRRAWLPTPVFLPGKSHGQRNLAGYSLWGHKESDMTEVTKLTNWHTTLYKLKVLNYMT